MLHVALIGSSWGQYQIFPGEDIYLQGLGVSKDACSFKRTTFHISRFRQKGQKVKVKIWLVVMSANRSKCLAYSERNEKLSNCQKQLRVHPIKHFSGNTRSFEVKKRNSQESVSLKEKIQFTQIYLDRRVASRSKLFAHSKMSKKTKKLVKIVQGALFEDFVANTRSCQVKTRTSKNLITLAEEPQFL